MSKCQMMYLTLAHTHCVQKGSISIMFTSNTKIHQHCLIKAFFLLIVYLMTTSINAHATILTPKQSSNMLWDYVDEEGEFVVPPKWSSAEEFRENILTPKQSSNMLWGYVDKEGEFVIPPKWSWAEAFRANRVACVGLAKNGKEYYGLIDCNGEYILSPQYPDITGTESGNYFGGEEEGYYHISGLSTEGDRWLSGLFDVKYMTFIEPFFGEVAMADRNEWNLLAVLCDDSDKWGFVNTKTGDLDIPCKYDDVWLFSEGYVACRIGDPDDGENQQSIIVNISGKETNVPQNHRLGYYAEFHDGRAPIYNMITSQIGYIDYEGNIVISCIYDDAENFDNGFARVRQNQEWYTIDTFGNVVDK